ncbi:hypothetical protein BJ138DRAFT_1160722 [Hygrophoropsis aurantiaca]|uniref:Uncharacterized protein n=1 Tax=Hygrophoropsis aurantiaca TaxID=72124 RepID=A0ACB8A1K5_9AGAM|nr:hypothetical protein BJ138DRAFT_1160722 [Hygrophoropsis aurantiaca]
MARTKAGPRIPSHYRPSKDSQPPTDPAQVAYRGYKPTIADIIRVRRYFTEIPHPLPLELINKILDDAWYWAHSSITMERFDRSPSWLSSPTKDRLYVRTLPLAIPGSEGDFAWEDEPEVLYNDENDSKKSIMLGGKALTESELWVPPLGRHPCRMIEFQIWSRDQGFSSDIPNHSTYRESRSWFDAIIETPNVDWLQADPISWPNRLLKRDTARRLLGDPDFTREDSDSPSVPPSTHVQRNVHASVRIHHHAITWHYLDSVQPGSADSVETDLKGQGLQSLDGTFVRRLKAGDCITLRMRSGRDPLLECIAEKAIIDVYWAV